MALKQTYWPVRIPRSLCIPQTAIDVNLEVSARRYPEKFAIIYYGAKLSYRQLQEEVNKMAGYLQGLGVKKQERVLLFMQNSPQFIIAYYAILRVGAIVVPVNPMNVTNELLHYINDGEVNVAFVGQELYERVKPLTTSSCLSKIIMAAYSDYCGAEDAPDVVKAERIYFQSSEVVHWMEALDQGEILTYIEARSDDLAVLPYTSGTTGNPKGCMHTHKTVQANIQSAVLWGHITAEARVLTTLPLFHVTGMIHTMHAPIYAGSTMVVMTRWERDTAAKNIERHRCTHWTAISTMIVDFLANQQFDYDISSLQLINGGGAPLPQAVGEKLLHLTGLRYIEGYGLTETSAQTHFNPVERPKSQCMGIPLFDVDARVVNPETLEEKGPGEEGELLVSGPQVFLGYWQSAKENENVFVELDGKRFLRTGDIAYFDEEGYFFMVDRLKRMINASGFKVSPSEVESILYKHPAIRQACVIGIPDERKGEEVKAFVVLHEASRDHVTESDIILWSQNHMAAYKYPRFIEFVESLPLSGSGKILWRQLQEEARKRQTAVDSP